MWGIPRLKEEVLNSHEGLCCIELVNNNEVRAKLVNLPVI
jgi:hypothetical protein